jgi:hypothetical protein
MVGARYAWLIFSCIAQAYDPCFIHVYKNERTDSFAKDVLAKLDQLLGKGSDPRSTSQHIKNVTTFDVQGKVSCYSSNWSGMNKSLQEKLCE